MIETIDPTTGKTLERIALMDAAAIDAKLEAAQRCSRIWATTSFEQRAELLRAVGASMRAQRDSLATTAVREMGKPDRSGTRGSREMRVGPRVLCRAR